MRKLSFLIAFCFISQLPTLPISAWGWESHKLICGLAEKKLTPKAKKKVKQWLSESEQLEGGVTDFPNACLWPDVVKHTTRKSTYKHHFINVPDAAYTIRLDRDCAADDCLVTGLQSSLNDLYKEPDEQHDLSQRAAALRFLGHYIADLHQPLHVGNASDWGGNKIQVMWRGKKTNLHALWDYEMPDAAGLHYPRSMGGLSSMSIKFDSATAEEWFNESLGLARSHAYADMQGRKLRSGATISEGYFERSRPIIIKRIKIAALRLAMLLNQIAEGEKVVLFKLLPIQS